MKNIQLTLTHLKQYSIIIDKRDTNSISGKNGKMVCFFVVYIMLYGTKNNHTLRTVA